MKIPFRFSSSFVLLLLSMFFASSCNQETNDPSPQKNARSELVKVVFNYTDNTFDESRIMNVKYDPETGKSLRTAQNLQVTGPITLTEGNYGVVELFNAAAIDIAAGDVTFGNVNPNNNDPMQPVMIIIRKGATLRISSSLNQNGYYIIQNYGTLITGNHELQQRPGNEYYNYGSHYVTGDTQINQDEAKYNNCGYVEVSNYTNFHSGNYNACQCGQLITNGLNVNKSRMVTGKGFIKVTGNLNLNGFLTTSKDIDFAYAGYLNEPDKVGMARRVDKPSCTPDPMPVRYTDIKAEPFKDSENKIGCQVSFNVTESSNLRDMQIMGSKDGKSWYVLATETNTEAFIPGKTYIKKFFIIE